MCTMLVAPSMRNGLCFQDALHLYLERQRVVGQLDHAHLFGSRERLVSQFERALLIA